MSRREREEFGPGRKGLIICSQCGVVYYKKSWHRNADHFKPLIEKEKDYSVKFDLCPACKMIKHNQYEGRIVISKAPAEHVFDLENLINNFCARARERDPLDRLIDLKKENGQWQITLTENQLANKLANKIVEVFKHSASISKKYVGAPSDVVEIEISFG